MRKALNSLTTKKKKSFVMPRRRVELPPPPTLDELNSSIEKLYAKKKPKPAKAKAKKKKAAKPKAAGGKAGVLLTASQSWTKEEDAKVMKAMKKKGFVHSDACALFDHRSDKSVLERVKIIRACWNREENWAPKYAPRKRATPADDAIIAKAAADKKYQYKDGRINFAKIDKANNWPLQFSRDRWKNKVDPRINSADFSTSELADIKRLRLEKEWGHRKIADFLSTDESIRTPNKVYSAIRRIDNAAKSSSTPKTTKLKASKKKKSAPKKKVAKVIKVAPKKEVASVVVAAVVEPTRVLSAYESARHENILRNQRELKRLGLDKKPQLPTKVVRKRVAKKAASSSSSMRSSSRANKFQGSFADIDDYDDADDDGGYDGGFEEEEQEEQQEEQQEQQEQEQEQEQVEQPSSSSSFDAASLSSSFSSSSSSSSSTVDAMDDASEEEEALSSSSSSSDFDSSKEDSSDFDSSEEDSSDFDSYNSFHHPENREKSIEEITGPTFDKAPMDETFHQRLTNPTSTLTMNGYSFKADEFIVSQIFFFNIFLNFPAAILFSHVVSSSLLFSSFFLLFFSSTTLLSTASRALRSQVLVLLVVRV